VVGGTGRPRPYRQKWRKFNSKRSAHRPKEPPGFPVGKVMSRVQNLAGRLHGVERVKKAIPFGGVVLGDVAGRTEPLKKHTWAGKKTDANTGKRHLSLESRQVRSGPHEALGEKNLEFRWGGRGTNQGVESWGDTRMTWAITTFKVKEKYGNNAKPGQNYQTS